LIGTTFSYFYTLWATNNLTPTITIFMCASIFGAHVVEANFDLHKLVEIKIINPSLGKLVRDEWGVL